MDLPEDKGTYVLIAQCTRMKQLDVGALGEFAIIPGFYAYVGSAFCSGGLRARIGHHLESTAEPHWHIDYLLQVAIPVEVWHTMADRKLEHHWAEQLEDAPGLRVTIPRFGSSDYHRSRTSHLFYSKRRPSFRRFQEQIMERFEGVVVERCQISTAASPDQTAGR
jgi:Uri superfamily endonuclease